MLLLPQDIPLAHLGVASFILLLLRGGTENVFQPGCSCGWRRFGRPVLRAAASRKRRQRPNPRSLRRRWRPHAHRSCRGLPARPRLPGFANRLSRGPASAELSAARLTVLRPRRALLVCRPPEQTRRSLAYARRLEGSCAIGFWFPHRQAPHRSPPPPSSQFLHRRNLSPPRPLHQRRLAVRRFLQGNDSSLLPPFPRRHSSRW